MKKSQIPLNNVKKIRKNPLTPRLCPKLFPFWVATPFMGAYYYRFSPRGRGGVGVGETQRRLKPAATNSPRALPLQNLAQATG